MQTRANRDQAERALEPRAAARPSSAPISSRQESAEQAQTAYDVAQANLRVDAGAARSVPGGLQEARDNLAKTRLISPISGRVVRLAVEEGEVAVPGTFSKETGLLMTIADLSVILAKVQVDETDVVRLSCQRFGRGHDRRLPRHHASSAGSPRSVTARS